MFPLASTTGVISGNDRLANNGGTATAASSPSSAIGLSP